MKHAEYKDGLFKMHLHFEKAHSASVFTIKEFEFAAGSGEATTFLEMPIDRCTKKSVILDFGLDSCAVEIK